MPKGIKRTRGLYMAEACLEYLISLLVAGTYLARITSELGLSDSLTGIISSFISLGSLFQLLSLLFRQRAVKRSVIALSITNQLLFMFLYVVPLIPLSQNAKTVIFIVTLLLAYLTYYIAHPKKINWFMSAVDNQTRGRFTAIKEMISLTVGAVFTILMGRMVDTYSARGDMRTAFVICGIVIFVLTVLHTLSMIFSVEPEAPVKADRTGFWQDMLALFKDKSVLRITGLFVLWYIASHTTSSFYGSYEIHELGFSQELAGWLATMGSVCRIAASFFWGWYADKKSFAKMLRWCFLCAVLAYTCAMLATPQTGVLCFSLYFAFHSIAMGGINSALTNLVFDYVPHEKRADSLAFSQALAGVAGFLATLAMSPLVDYIQSNGNRLFGVFVYAQQVTSLVAVILTLLCAAYVTFVIIKKEKQD